MMAQAFIFRPATVDKGGGTPIAMISSFDAPRLNGSHSGNESSPILFGLQREAKLPHHDAIASGKKRDVGRDEK